MENNSLALVPVRGADEVPENRPSILDQMRADLPRLKDEIVHERAQLLADIDAVHARLAQLDVLARYVDEMEAASVPPSQQQRPRRVMIPTYVANERVLAAIRELDGNGKKPVRAKEVAEKAGLQTYHVYSAAHALIAAKKVISKGSGRYKGGYVAATRA